MPDDSLLPPPSEVTGLILAGGRGERLGGWPKAFLRHGGRSLLEIAVDLLRPCAARIVAGVPGEHLEAVRHMLAGRPQVACIVGGASREATVLALLAQADTPYVVLHEVARPFAPASLVGDVLAAVAGGADGAVPLAPLAWRDSVVRIADGRMTEVLERAALRSSQTPQAFRRAVLVASLADHRDETTCYAPLLRAGATVAAVETVPGNLKITYDEDLALLDGDGAA